MKQIGNIRVSELLSKDLIVIEIRRIFMKSMVIQDFLLLALSLIRTVPDHPPRTILLNVLPKKVLRHSVGLGLLGECES